MIQRNVTRLFYLRGLKLETFMRGKFKVMVMEIMVKCLTVSGKLWFSHSQPVEENRLSGWGLISTLPTLLLFLYYFFMVNCEYCLDGVCQVILTSLVIFNQGFILNLLKPMQEIYPHSINYQNKQEMKTADGTKVPVSKGLELSFSSKKVESPHLLKV